MPESQDPSLVEAKKLYEERTRLQELIRRAEASRQVRLGRALVMKQWYEMGTQDGKRARYNKLYSHLNRVASFLFSPGTVRFGVHLPPNTRTAWLPAAAVARDEFRQTWEDAQADGVMDLALEWSLVYGSIIPKVQKDPETGFRFGNIEPWDFGVTREDVPALDDQDVFCHWYTLSVPQVERWLHGHKRERDLTALAREHAMPRRGGASAQRLVVSAVTGTFPGGTITGGFPAEAPEGMPIEAIVEEPTVEFVDVWERRLFRPPKRVRKDDKDIFEDWLVTTVLAGAHESFLSRRNPELPWTRTGQIAEMPAELPFIVMRPRPILDYFWGRCELDNLIQIQNWLDAHGGSLKEVIDRQLKPPKFFTGLIGEAADVGQALDTLGGAAGSADPNAKMQTIIPELRPEALKLWELILEMFNDISGVPGSISEPASMPGGVRATGHFSMAAGIGAGRVRKMALIIESSLSQAATKAFHLLQRNNTDRFERPDGQPFLLSQIPSRVRLTVNAHSAAPIFHEQEQAKGVLLHRAGAIDGEDLVELVDPVNREELKEKAKKLAAQKAEQAREVMELQHERVASGKAPIKTKGL